MSITKGFTRIALVLAMISAIPGFLGGWHIYEVEKTMKVRWYGDKMLPFEEIPEQMQKKIDEKLSKKFQKKIKETESGLTPEEYQKLIDAKNTILPPVEYYYPQNWQCAIAGVAGSSIAFLIVFFGINGITRISLWIVEGFREQK